MEMFGFLKRRNPTIEAAEISAALALATVDLANWRAQPEKWSAARILAISLIALWAAQTMWLQFNDSDQTDLWDETLSRVLKHRTMEASLAVRQNAMLAWDKLRDHPLRHQCMHNFARTVGDKDPSRHLDDLSRNTLPQLEAWCHEFLDEQADAAGIPK